MSILEKAIRLSSDMAGYQRNRRAQRSLEKFNRLDAKQSRRHSGFNSFPWARPDEFGCYESSQVTPPTTQPEQFGKPNAANDRAVPGWTRTSVKYFLNRQMVGMRRYGEHGLPFYEKRLTEVKIHRIDYTYYFDDILDSVVRHRDGKAHCVIR